jgi:hypothetical protein
MPPAVTIREDGDRQAMRSMRPCGAPAELLGVAGIHAEHVAQAVRECIHEAPHQETKEGRA